MATRLTSNRPKLETPILWGMAAGIAWTISGYTIARWATSIAYIATFAALAGLILSGIDYLTFTIARRWNDFSLARSGVYLQILEAENTKLRSLGVLNSDQIAALGHYLATIETIPGMNMLPIQFLIVGDRKIDFAFVDEFLASGTRDYLAPVRRWSEGSNKRLDADALTAFLVANQFAEPPAGNMPARWRDRVGGLASIGIEPE